MEERKMKHKRRKKD